ncbi:MAG: hypothetical protein ABW022_20455 [Actinoplanes sp.]
MTTRYEIGLSKAGVNTANTVMWQLRAPTRRSVLYELGIFVDSAPTTAPQFVLARATAGGTSSTSAVGLALIPEAPAATTTLDSAWSSAPTFNTSGTMIRRCTLPVTAGSGIVWGFPDGLAITTTATTNLIIANAVASGATLGQFTVYASWRE